jgi:hypothetical protein
MSMAECGHKNVALCNCMNLAVSGKSLCQQCEDNKCGQK